MEIITTFNEGTWDEYRWLVVVGALVAFMMAWSIGANDVANSFATSVGSKTLTLWQACLVATFCEFTGAIALGGPVAKTISGGIARPEKFYDSPELFAYGMLCALAGSTTWVTTATYLELAVSTTHTIIGSVIGFALVWQGVDAVVWNDKIDEFPYAKGLVPIMTSWFVSPLLAGTICALLFIANRWLILRRQNAAQLSFWALPPLVGITIFINLFFVFFKGAKNELHWDENKAAWVAACCAAGAVILSIVIILPWLKYKMRKDEEAAEQKQREAAEQAAKEAADPESGKEGKGLYEEEPDPNSAKGFAHKYLMRMKTALTHGLQVDIHEDVDKDEKVSAMHANAEVFDPKAEHVYSYLQVFSACCMSFAHGANDVANAIGPFSAIWYVYNNFKVSSSAETPKWILAMGGVGIVVGLGTYGYNIMKALGVKLCKITPSRGYCCELSTALTVSVASVFGLPISSTHCIVGAEVAVGLTEHLKTGANWKLFGKTFASWVFTILIAAALSAALFAFGAYAPSITMSKQIGDLESILKEVVMNNNKTLAAFNGPNSQLADTLNAPVANVSNVVGKWVDVKLAQASSNISTNMKNLFDHKKQGFVDPVHVKEVVMASYNLFANNSVVSVGYNKAAATYGKDALTVPAGSA